MSVFADTSALLAVLSSADINHPVAGRILRGLVAEDETLISTNYVVVETFALAQRRFGLDAVRTLQQDILPLLDLHWVTQSEHEAGVSAVLAAGRRQLSVVDCVSFEVMRRIGLNRVFCFDPHFEEQGFEVLK
ncbi:MAG: PIN domain-containing protein [Planctomycetes bacterium]|nr:PIN domain-containing protein [Planctomycetota bacterium]